MKLVWPLAVEARGQKFNPLTQIFEADKNYFGMWCMVTKRRRKKSQSMKHKILVA